MKLVWVIVAILISVVIFLAAWFAFGSAGYRAGSVVGVGSWQIDPELLRVLYSLFITTIATPFLTWLATKFPALAAALMELLKSHPPSPFIPPTPASNSLTPDEQKALLGGVARTEAMVERILEIMTPKPAGKVVKP